MHVEQRAPLHASPLDVDAATFDRAQAAHWMLGGIAASYAIDTLVLAAFAWAGALAAWVPWAYAATGLACCLGFYRALTRRCIASARARSAGDVAVAPDDASDLNRTLLQLAIAATVQLAFVVLAPAVALYFVGVLFIVFAIATLRLRLRDAALAWLGVSIALTVAIALLPHALDVPHATPLERVLVCVSILLVLGRCVLLGTYAASLRTRIGDRYAAAKRSIETSDRRAATVARELHEDLGQDLTGIALALTAHATRARARREGRAGAEELAESAAQLQAAIAKTRVLAGTLDAGARHVRADARFVEKTPGGRREVRAAAATDPAASP